MYQQNPHFDLEYLKDPEKEFNKLVGLFKNSVGIKDSLGTNDKPFNLANEYMINWACIWNKISNIGRHCTIVQKDSEFALVVFEDDMEITQDKFYRLEDLTEINAP